MKKTICLAAIGLSFCVAQSLRAQAPPGPIPPAPSATSSTAPPPPVKRVEPRKSIMGAWKLNRDDSDNPRQKSNQRSTDNSTGNRGGNGGPRVGWPGGGMGGGGMGGGGRQGNGGPPGGSQSGSPKGGTPEEKQRYQELLDPSVRLDVAKRNDKDPIVEMMGDQGRKTIFYTDGHKPDAPAGVGTEVVEARWEGTKLVSDATLPKAGTVKRTYEVSPDGTQLWEEIEMVVGKDKNPSKFRFVYDAVAAEVTY